MVAAPSKLQRPVGDRVKTDARDALRLARLLRLGEIVSVRVPTIEQETARDLVRAREDNRGELMAARHRLSKLLLRHGIVWDGKQGLQNTACQSAGDPVRMVERILASADREPAPTPRPRSQCSPGHPRFAAGAAR